MKKCTVYLQGGWGGGRGYPKKKKILFWVLPNTDQHRCCLLVDLKRCHFLQKKRIVIKRIVVLGPSRHRSSCRVMSTCAIKSLVNPYPQSKKRTIFDFLNQKNLYFVQKSFKSQLKKLCKMLVRAREIVQIYM